MAVGKLERTPMRPFGLWNAEAIVESRGWGKGTVCREEERNPITGGPCTRH
jgi:hypothetical protein